MTNFKHIPVMPKEVLEYLAPKKGKTYVDGTLGGAGHAKLVLEKIAPTGRLIGIDQDIEAITHAKSELKNYGNSVIYVNDNFRNLKNIFEELEIKEVSGILLDLGVSTHQLISSNRGFSFSLDEGNLSQNLDMRMGLSSPKTAADIVSEYSQKDLANLFFNFGEEKYSRSIAKEIIKKRPLLTIGDLLECIKLGTPPNYREGKPPAKWASNTFRALRMEVNEEIEVIKEILDQSLELLESGGRLVVITFHSIEDRVIKQKFAGWAKSVPKMPGYESLEVKPKVNILTKKPILPNITEQQQNPASKSAKLRAIEKI
jgi:16S rRNA (cytosine1402-N4)-methyltransferase